MQVARPRPAPPHFGRVISKTEGPGWPGKAVGSAGTGICAGWHLLGSPGGAESAFPRPAPDVVPDLLTEITRAARRYYAQAADVQLTAADFFDWLARLNPAEAAVFQAKGFALAQHEWAFMRFALEARGLSMREWMLRELPVEAYELWAANGEFNGDLARGLSRL